MHSELKRKELNDTYIYFFAIYIIIQPILDTIWFYDGTIAKVFGFTIPTLIRFIGLFALFIISIFFKKNRNLNIIFFAYFLFVIVYFYAHDKHARCFSPVLYNDPGYSTVGEVFYILRMLLPWTVTFLFLKNSISRKTFRLTTTLLSVVMSSSIVISNILRISLGSYTNQKIKGNIFDWFICNHQYVSNEFASKGFLYFSISTTVMIITYPYIIYKFIEEKRMIYAIMVFLEAVALLMVGTKVTAYGAIVMPIIMLVIYFLCGILKNDYKIDKRIIISVLIFIFSIGVIYNFSPANMKINQERKYSKYIDMKEKDKEIKKDEDRNYKIRREPDSIILYINKNINDLSIKKEFLTKSYNYKKDPIFWYDLIESYKPSERMQNRLVERLMLERVKAINNNKKDDILGIGYTRTSRIYNLEQDFIYQYYSLGYLGALLFVGPYIIIIIISGLSMCINFRDKMTIRNCSLLLGLGFTCCSAYFSGNTLEMLGVSSIMGWFSGEIVSRIIKKNGMMQYTDV